MSMLIDCHDLSVAISDKRLLTNISFNIEAADYLCILGPNGAGKSTLLKCLMGILPGTQGSLKLEGATIETYKQKALARLVSYVPQATGRNLTFVVDDFVKMGRYSFHTALSNWSLEDHQAVENALNITDTTTFRHRDMNTLSGGECQRVMIAAALAQQSPILLLDEPTSFLDPHHQVEVHQLIKKLNQHHHITIIEVSHDLNHASQHSKRILALKDGKMIWLGQSSDFIEQQRLHDLYGQDFVFVDHPQTGAKIALPDEQR